MENIDAVDLSDADLKAKLEETAPGVPDAPEPKPPSEPEDKPAVDEFSELSKEELAEKARKLKKQVDDKESFIQKRRGEISELKRLIAEKKQTFVEENPDPEFKDKFFEDPAKGVDVILQKKESVKQREKLLDDEYRLDTEDFVLNVDPEFYGKLDDMVDIVVNELKVPKDRALAFRNDPFAEKREILVDLIRRVERRNFQAEMEKLKNKPKEMIDKIEQLSKRKPMRPMPDKRAGDIDKVQIASLSDSELADYLKERKQQ